MDFSDEIIEKMMESGYIEEVGLNAVGEPLYRITPLFYEEQSHLVEQIKKIDSDLLNSLWFKEYIDLMMDEDGLSYIYLNDKSDKWINSNDLNEEERAMMYLIYSTGAYYGTKKS